MIPIRKINTQIFQSLSKYLLISVPRKLGRKEQYCTLHNKDKINKRKSKGILNRRGGHLILPPNAQVKCAGDTCNYVKKYKMEILGMPRSRWKSTFEGVRIFIRAHYNRQKRRQKVNESSSGRVLKLPNIIRAPFQLQYNVRKINITNAINCLALSKQV